MNKVKWYVLPITIITGELSFLGVGNILGNGTCESAYVERVCVSGTTYEANGKICGDLVCWSNVVCDAFCCA